MFDEDTIRHIDPFSNASPFLKFPPSLLEGNFKILSVKTGSKAV
jgi:hypothetical protein